MRTAAALVIGNELLTGKIHDQNIVVLARTLRSAGVELRRVVMVLDDLDTIAAEVRSLSASHDTLFTSGGVGPTHDDVTIAAVARAFGVEVVGAPEIEQMLRAYYGDRITEGHLAMAKVPAGARLSRSKGGVWPAIIKENVWVLPGVPQIFAMKMQLVKEELSTGKGWLSGCIHQARRGLSEGAPGQRRRLSPRGRDRLLPHLGRRALSHQAHLRRPGRARRHARPRRPPRPPPSRLHRDPGLTGFLSPLD
ncbi:MAG: molybdopterin-binding protein [Polyangiaceae bacterium]